MCEKLCLLIETIFKYTFSLIYKVKKGFVFLRYYASNLFNKLDIFFTAVTVSLLD